SKTFCTGTARGFAARSTATGSRCANGTRCAPTNSPSTRRRTLPKLLLPARRSNLACETRFRRGARCTGPLAWNAAFLKILGTDIELEEAALRVVTSVRGEGSGATDFLLV